MNFECFSGAGSRRSRIAEEQPPKQKPNDHGLLAVQPETSVEVSCEATSPKLDSIIGSNIAETPKGNKKSSTRKIHLHKKIINNY